VNENSATTLESDPRFPSGPWTGFWVQKFPPLGRHGTELHLTFRQGEMQGEGRDIVGDFVVRGRYQLEDGRCWWTKRYLGKHDVFYNGFNEGKGIWGVWEIPASREYPAQKGGFHIWPEGTADPTGEHLTEAADLPLELEEVEAAEPVAAPAGSAARPVVYFPAASGQRAFSGDSVGCWSSASSRTRFSM
jgi:hypothetical protein